MPSSILHRARAFTLVELLVVIGIIALLISILLPVINRANESAKTVACLSNLRQLGLAAQMYCDSNHGSFPIAYYKPVNQSPLVVTQNWDFTTTRNTVTGEVRVEPGILWFGRTNPKIQQCPSYDGKSNTLADPYTGYNYNTSFIGHGESETIAAPARISQVRNASRCALFGDGQYYGGADKFMRAPFPTASDTFPYRSAGTQGFRHRGMSNVVFVDGHAESLSHRYVQTTAQEQPNIGAGTGFLSADNSLYTLQ